MKTTQFLFLVVPFYVYGQWAEETLSKMSIDEKIGQVIVIPACEFRSSDHREDLRHLIVNQHIGGIIFKQGTSSGQIAFYNDLQKIASLPLLGMQDAEPGLLSRRVLDFSPLPKNLTLGAIQDVQLIEDLGRQIGLQCRSLGFFLSLSPVVDVNSNPNNPIIGMRSFGDDPKRVAACSLAYLKGVQEAGILACAKHFPGHGDTSVDSHKALPAVAHNLNRIHQVELYPFKKMIDHGVAAVMTAHLFVPSIDPLVPLTFSKPLVQHLLREEMGFQGLIISDALNMGALAGSYSPGEIALKAFLAGHDCLLYGDHVAPNIDKLLRRDIPEAMDALKRAFAIGVITEEMLDERVLRILQAKERLGLHLKRNLEEPAKYFPKELRKKLYEKAMTLVRDEELFLPLSEEEPISLVSIGNGKVFANELHFTEQSGKVVIAIYDLTIDPKPLFTTLREKRIPFAVVIFGSPYSLPKYADAPCVLMAYEDDPDAESAAARVMRGRLSPEGVLPIHLD